jgi:hypothetical protein
MPVGCANSVLRTAAAGDANEGNDSCAERLRKAGEHRQVAVKLDADEATNAERRKPIWRIAA